MSIDDRILVYLRAHPSGADDGEITSALGLKRRAQATALCKAMQERGLLTREHIHGKVKNLLAVPEDDGSPATVVLPPPPGGRWDRPWTWDGNLRVALQIYLAAAGYTPSPAPVPSPDGTPDITAVDSVGRSTRIALRGYPPETSKSKSGQARQYFANALLDAASWRTLYPGDAVAIALPDVITYRTLVAASAWFHAAASSTVYWIRADGGVGESKAP